VLSGTPAAPGSVQIGLSVTGTNGLAATTSVTLNIRSPSNDWRSARFSQEEVLAGAADSLFDFDLDGLPNLLEYAFATDPRSASGRIMDVVKTDREVLLSFLCDSSRTDIVYVVQSSPTVGSGSWVDIARSTGGSMTFLVDEACQVADSGVGTRIVVLRVPILDLEQQFFRVLVRPRYSEQSFH
jgi:hypothetical protein